MGNRHYYGGDRREEPELSASWWRIAFSWLVTIPFVLCVAPVSGDKIYAFIVLLFFFPVIALLMLGVVCMGLLTLVNAVRGTGPRPDNLMFWLETLPTAIGLLAGVNYLAALKGPW
ncbi:MAG: hypothetical protein KIS72_02975 [Luteimonas sp.]|nr:hypothetical protein [Luteimonas sp.]